MDSDKLGNMTANGIFYTSTGLILAIMVVISYFVFFHSESVEPGFELVVVDKPFFFGHDGVRETPVREGRIVLWRTSSVVQVPVTPMSTRIVIDDFSSSNNILLDFESTIQFKVTNSPSLIKSFGEQWFNNNISQQYLSLVRDIVKTKTMEEMMSNPKTADEVDRQITTQLIALVKDSGLPIQIINVSLGRAKPNADVLVQMNKTASEQQRLKTLIEATAAEKQREKEQEARAIADNAYRNKMGLSPEQFVQLEAIRRYSDACSKSTCVIGTGASVIMSPGK